MGKKVIFSLFLYFFTGLGMAQTPADEAYVKAQGMMMVKAFNQKDYARVIRFTHPAIVKKMGGKLKAKIILKHNRENLQSKGTSFYITKLGDPVQWTKGKGSDQVLIPQYVDMVINGKKLKVISHLVAISYDKGRNWYFLNGMDNKAERFRELIPELSTDIAFPEMKVLN